MTTPASFESDVNADPAAVYRRQRLAFRIHAAVFAASMVLIFTVNLLVNLAADASGWSAWWSIWALLGWSLGLATHGLVVLLARPADLD